MSPEPVHASGAYPRVRLWWQKRRDSNVGLSWCAGCPDHEGCSQGMCYLDGGPAHPENRCPSGGCRICFLAVANDDSGASGGAE